MMPDRLRLFFEASADAMLLVERDRVVDCNGAALSLLRRERREDLLGAHLWALSPAMQPDGRNSAEIATDILGRVEEHGRDRVDWTLLRPDGTALRVELVLTAVPGPDGALIHVICRDLSDRLKLERQLRRARKMVGIRSMAADLAHDFNNLLLAIIGNGAILEEAVGQDPELGPPVAEIRDAAERASELVRQILAYARRTERSPRPFDLNRTLAACEEKLRSFIGDRVRLRTVFAPQPLRVEGEAGRLEQIVVGLVTHAARSLSGGGTVSLETCERPLEEERIGVRIDLPPGQYAMIAVSSAAAVPAGDRTPSVDPYALGAGAGPKPSPEVTSLREMVRRDRGDLEVYGPVGPGATVKVYLPLVAANGGPLARRVVVTGAPRGSEAVLLVEDEGAVAGVCGRLLERNGYRVVHARDGEEALAMMRSRGEAIDLVLTDVVMPRMGGPEMVRRLREGGGTARVLYCSGYTRNALRELGVVGEEEEVLLKPFSPRDLLEGVRRALDRSRPLSPGS